MTKHLDSSHWDRTAYVDVPQSTGVQILEGPESTNPRHGRVGRARALGWSSCVIEFLDDDPDESGESARRRDGFARVVEVVVEGDASAILVFEVSTWRSSEDWRRSPGLGDVAGVVPMDEQVSCDPAGVDDELLPTRGRR